MWTSLRVSGAAAAPGDACPSLSAAVVAAVTRNRGIALRTVKISRSDASSSALDSLGLKLERYI